MSGVKIERLSTDDPAALGPYQVIGRLASGGMGRIYLARSPGRMLVAVKTLLAEGVVGDADRRRFAREVTLAQRVESGWTARVLDADAAAERPWMAIEYIAAPSLAELVRTAGQPPASAVRWVGAGVAAALVALHGEGIVHRDIKPANVLLPLNGPRVIDFGISHANDITRTSLTLGTIAFTSPEQARGEPSAEASDVYSLGATLFQLAVGRPPYTDDGDTLRLLARVTRGELDLEGLPRELDQLIRPCLAADPAARPRPADVLDQFTRGIAGLPVSHSGNRWLPPRWTALIHAYDQQGRALRRNHPAPGAAEAPTVDERTQGVPAPGPTRQYTREHAGRPAAGEARREQDRLRAARERERAAEEHERAEAERAQRRALRDAMVRAKAANRDAGPRVNQAGPAAGPPRPTAVPKPPAAAPPNTSGRGNGALFVAVVCVILLFIFEPWAQDESSGASSSGASSGSASSGGRTTSYPSYTPPPPPRPSAADLVFRALGNGDCVSSYDDGYGEWSDSVPKQVDCDAADAYNFVETASNSASVCAGAEQQAWRNLSDDNVSTTLCLSRQYRAGQCFPAGADDSDGRDGRLDTVWNCAADTVPKGYKYVMQITGYYKKPSSMANFSCAEYSGDRTYYYQWEVNNGKSVVCAKTV